jgi:tetratricopeptide (TPR) repeat protein
MPDDLVLSKDALLQVLATDGPLDSETVRNGWMLLWSRECDFEATSKLLTRYLAQPLSDSETAWAYINLANSLAVTEHAAEAVHAHETFERWLPGKSPRLSSTWPYYPAPDGSPEVKMGPDEIRVTFLAQSVEFATAYAAVGRYADYVAKADAALAGLTPTQDNLEVRFYGLLIFMTASEVAGDFERAERHLLAMHAIADQAENASKVAELHAFAVTYEIQLARGRNDPARVAEKLHQALLLLQELEKNGSSGTDLHGYRHHLAHHLTQVGQHDLALPLLDANLSTGGHSGNGYAWLMHAAAVWQVTRDGARALGLLRDARAHDGRDLVGDFQAFAAFRDVKDDPEFLQAISRAAVS